MPTQSYLAVADIHGHLAHLDTLIRYQTEVYPSAHVVTLGDYCDNGPDTPGVIDRLIELQSDRFSSIIGNHDLACLRTLGWPGEDPDESWYQRWSCRYWSGWGTPAAYMADSAHSLSKNMAGAHKEFLKNLPWFFETDDLFFVHAGMKKGSLMHQRDALARKELPDHHFHTPPQLRDKRLATTSDPLWAKVVVSGHTKDPGRNGGHPYLAKNRICLSGDVDVSQTLKAILLPEMRTITVSPELIVEDHAPGWIPLEIWLSSKPHNNSPKRNHGTQK